MKSCLMNRGLVRIGLVVVASAFFVSGCDLNWQALQPPASISKEITFVMDNSARFSQDPADPLANVAPGEVRDDLSRLSGCWGTSYVSAFVVPFLGYETYRFDPSSGKFRYYQFQTPSAYIEDTADYVVTYPNSITLRNISRVAHLLEEPILTEGPVNVLLTLQDDRLKIAYIRQGGGYLNGTQGAPDDLRVALVFKAFDCP
jgi:hypothetical protein